MKAHPDAIPLMGLPPVKATAWNHAPPLPCGTSSQSPQPHLEDCTTYYPPRQAHQTGLFRSEPPSEKFAIRYVQAHLRRLEPVGRSADLLCDSAKMEVYILRSLLPPIQPQLHPNRLPMRTVLFCVD